MDDKLFHSSFKGTKEYTQWEVPTANATGFVAAADDYAERGIDLNEQLVRNKPATFYMRVNSSAMSGAGIFKDDVVIVDRSLEPTNGKVIIAVLDGELLIRKLEINNGRRRLVAVGPRLSAIDVEGADFSVWGVVTYSIHKT